MVHETLYTCSDLYEQGTGAKWENLVYARTGEGYGAYVHPQGSKSATEYKPKDLCYIYKYNKIDPEKYKVGNVYWTVVFRKYNLNKNNFPKIRIYSGKKGNNTFIREITTFTKLENILEYDNHTLQFKLGALTIDQLKSLIVKVVWDKTKSTEASEISINRARLSINYLPLKPKFSLYAAPALATITNNDEFLWTLTAKNTGDCGSGTATVQLPDGVEVVSANKSTYNNVTKKWSFSLCQDKTDTLQLRLRFPFVAQYTLTATNDSSYAVNKTVTSTVNVEQYYPSPSGERIEYTFYRSFAFEDGYFDVGIWGVYNGESVHCYDITIPAGLTVETPLRDTIIDLGPNSNVERFIDSEDVEIEITEDNRICLKVSDVLANFEAHIRIPFHAHNDGTYPITTRSLDTDTDYSKDLVILEPRGVKLFSAPVISKDKMYVHNSMNIGSPHVWTVRAKASSKNFFDERKDTMEIDLEQMIAYIGVVPLDRCHKADVTASSKNTLIENRYLNRAYYGKKGDYSEDIKMTLRMAWYDVATLQGLCEMDKPIPIDTIPYYPDGDPLNHRGWAEIHGVTNIKKINDLYYECDVEVTYLTHKIITKFGVTEGAKITANAIKYYLSLIHDYTDEILELFRPNYYQMFTSLEDTNGNCKGAWEIDAPNQLILNNVKDINKYSTYDIVFRNQLPALMSEDYDGNWEMSLKIVDKDSRKTLFEHAYTNFKHYDFEHNVAVNSADANTTYLNGNAYETLNFDKVGLGYDNFSPLIENYKTPTHFNTMENTVLESYDDQFEVFLLDKENKGISNQVVKVDVEGFEGYTDSFNVITDLYGRVIFDVNWGNGYYTITLTYAETEEYRGCTYSTDLNINFEYREYHFDYPKDVTAFTVNYPFIVTLLDENEDPVPNVPLYFSFKTMNGEYGYERKRITDENGQINAVIDWVNGTIMLKVAFKGATEGGVIYQPIMFEEPVNINFTTKETVIEADDFIGVLGYKAPTVSAILKDTDGNPLTNKRIFVAYYTDNQTIRRTSYTNEYGAIQPLADLVGGAWKVDLHFDGDSEYRPSVKTINGIIENFEQLDTYITSENYVLNEDDVRNGLSDYYNIYLIDKYNNPVSNEPVSITVIKEEDTDPIVDMVLYTDDNGKIAVPYLDNGCNVSIFADYQGCTRYNPCSNGDVITFEETAARGDVTFSAGNNKITIKKGYGAAEDIAEATDTVDRFIVNYDGDYRSCYDGLFYYKSMNIKTYKVTLFYKGSDNFHSKAETLTFVKITDTRKSFADFVALQENASSNVHGTASQRHIGGMTHFTQTIDCELPPFKFVVFLGSSATTYSDNLYNQADSVVWTVPKYKKADDGHIQTVLDFWGLMASNGKLTSWIVGNDFIRDTYAMNSYNTLEGNVGIVNLTQQGFAEDNNTFQNIKVLAHHSDAPADKLVNNWFYMKLLNVETLEEFYYQSYYIDNVTPINIQFELEKSLYDSGNNWELEIVSKDNDIYRGAYLRTTGRIDTDTIITEPQDTIITEETNYVELGDNSPTFQNNTILTSFGDYGIHSIMNMEYTRSNYYILTFNEFVHGFESEFIIGADPTLETMDGLFISPQRIRLYNDDTLVDEYIFDNPPFNQAPQTNAVKVRREGNTFTIFVNDTQIYQTDLVTWNTFGVYQWDSAQTEFTLSNFKLEPYVVDDITPATNDYDGSIFGSNWHIEFREDHLNFTDYGMLPQGAVGGGMVIVNDVPLPKDLEWDLEITTNYNNRRFERLNALYGEIQARLFEDVSTAENTYDYANALCSPSPVPNARTMFTRHSDEGTLYFVKPDYVISEERGKVMQKPAYLCNAYNQYKGGCEMYTETGISLFSLDNAHSPVYVGNDLVRAEFHRRSGYVVLSRYDELTDSWYSANILKVPDNLKLSVGEYNDDYVRINFGATTWEFYRGRPFIVLKHPNTNIRILKIVDRVYCETLTNEQGMGFIEEHNTYMSEFNPQLSIQQFKKELHIGENIRADNFELYEVDDEGNIVELTHNAALYTSKWDNENALIVDKNFTGKLALNFPDDTLYVKKPADTFSLLIGKIDVDNQTSITVKARGFDENGEIQVKEGVQYGIWEQAQTFTVNSNTEEIRATFTDCPKEVKYIDFIVIFNTATTSEIKMTQFMCYEGDSEPNWDIDTSMKYANDVEVLFDETYYANIYFEDSPVGLCVIRPTQEPFALNTLKASAETVLAPYMKKSKEWDKPENVFLEYLNAKRQTIDINWEEF